MRAGRELDALVHGSVMGVKGGFADDAAFLPPYSTDIAAAWKVVDHLAAQTRWWEMSRRPYTDGKGCRFNFMGDPHYDTYAETVPLAICLAALAAVGIKVRQ